jgi:hypothetical protein
VVGVALAGSAIIDTMLRQAFAALLLLLTASPFTAPFATCDVAALLSDQYPAAPTPLAVTASVEDGSHTVPLCAASSGIRSRIKIISRTVASDSTANATPSVPRVLRSAPSRPGHSAAQSLSSLRI